MPSIKIKHMLFAFVLLILIVEFHFSMTLLADEEIEKLIQDRVQYRLKRNFAEAGVVPLRTYINIVLLFPIFIQT